MSRWILQSAASDSDPISFERLAQMLAQGVINETDLLRPEHGDDWQAVDSVIGLCRAADKLRSSNAACDDSKDCEAKVEGNVATEPSDRLSNSAAQPSSVAVRAVAQGANGETAVSGREVPTKTVSWRRVSLLCIGLVMAGWCGWSYWIDSLRFPKPAHIANNPEPLMLPWIGAVSGFEVLMIAVDTIAVMTFVVWWFRSKRHAR